jgi:hypothetical protein
MADSPKEAEAAQALFCAIVDYEGKKISPIPNNYIAFRSRYGKVMNRIRRKVVTPGIPMQRIENLLLDENNGWYESSVNIANKLFDDIKKLSKKTHNKIKPKGLELFYVRGDNNVMGNLTKIFKHTNKKVKERNRELGINDLTFNDLNKWSPADIYVASKQGQRLLKEIASGKTLNKPIMIGKTAISSLNSFMSFAIFNAVMKEMIDNGDILPLSLKKAPNKDSVVIKTINYKLGDVAQALETKNVGYHGYVFSQTKDVYNSKDVYLKITTQHKMQFRDKGGTGGGQKPVHSYQGIITGGKQALDGSLGGGSIGDVLYQSDRKIGRFFSFANQKRIISMANKIADRMQINMDVDGELDEKTLNNRMCNDVYEYAKKYTNIPVSTLGTKMEFYTNLYKHDQYGRMGTATRAVPAGNEILAKRAIAQFLFGKFLGGNLIDAMENAGKVKANEMTINLVLYAGSRTDKSSPHFKAADVSSF